MRILGAEVLLTLAVAMLPEPCNPTRLGFIGIYRKRVIVAPTWMRHMIGAPTQRALIEGVDHIEDQR